MRETPRFHSGADFHEVFDTDRAWIVLSAMVEVHGTVLHLTNFAIEPLETKSEEIGTRGVLSILRKLENYSHEEGYTHMQIEGQRMSGANPNRHVEFRRRT